MLYSTKHTQKIDVFERSGIEKLISSLKHGKWFIGLLVLYILAIANWLDPPEETAWLTSNTFMVPIFFLPGPLALLGLIFERGLIRLLAVILIPIALISAMLGSVSLIFPSDDGILPARAIRGEEFRAVHSLLLQRDLNILAIFPKNPIDKSPEFIVIDKTVFSPTARTYGNLPRLQAYENLAKDGSVHRYRSLKELFKQQEIDLSVRAFNQTIRSMKKLGIHEFIKDPETGVIVYEWNSWVLTDPKGVVYAPSGNIPRGVLKNFQGRDIWRLNRDFFGWQSREGFFWQGSDNW